ncbi:hypothetical protein BDV29DRAFT_158064 [Aspergillus leporis]|jgi:hypothetical protein|uniref:Uncharacterized protein n=1 Tax=Aspergillus leporis TaxID=41062 RepID=A0A5N5X0R0_9EURO|nr:hypothetical protein BDV29DRAFT_158064 [Aspergillus leporis]
MAMPEDPSRHDYWQVYAEFLEECLFILENGGDEMVVFKKARPSHVEEEQTDSDGSEIYEACEEGEDCEEDGGYAPSAYCDYGQDEDEDYFDMMDEGCEPDLQLYTTTFDLDCKDGEPSVQDLRRKLRGLITKDILSCEKRNNFPRGRLYTKPALQFR